MRGTPTFRGRNQHSFIVSLARLETCLGRVDHCTTLGRRARFDPCVERLDPSSERLEPGLERLDHRVRTVHVVRLDPCVRARKAPV